MSHDNSLINLKVLQILEQQKNEQDDAIDMYINAPEKERGVIIIDDAITSRDKEVQIELSNLAKSNLIAPEMKQHKPNTGTTIGSYKFKSKK